MKMLRTLAVLGNAALLVFIVVLAVTSGFRNDGIGSILLFFALVLLLLANIYLLWTSRKESWVGLFFKRKALEEKRRIRELEV